MSQNSIVLPTTGTVSGLQQTQNANNALDTLNTLWSGASAPSSPEAGQLWHDTTTGTLKLRSLDNTQWILLFYCMEGGPYLAVPVNVPGGHVNKFRNGTMDIWQRGTSITVTAGTSSYTADGWIVSSSGANVTVTQGSIGFGTKYYLQITGASGVTDTSVRQRIESSIAAQLNLAGSVTVQANIYNNTGASLTPTITVRHAGSTDNWTSPVTDVNAVNLQSCPNGQNTVVCYTFVPNSASYNGLEITFDFGAALNSGTSSLRFSDADLRLTPGVPTGLNPNPPPFEARPIGAEMAINARYYEKSYAMATAPGTGPGAGSCVYTLSGPAASQASTFSFSARKRVAPTMTFYDGSGTSGKVSYYNGSWNNGGAISASAGNESSFYVQSNISGSTEINFDWTASAEL